jgi:Rod binding domain-containing protein
MNTAPLQTDTRLAAPSPAAPPLPQAPLAPGARRPNANPLLRAQETFAQSISRAQERPGQRDPVVEARSSAEQLVSLALVEPTLKLLRESSMAAPPFAPTGAEKQFGAMLDSQRAADIVQSANMPLVDRLVRDLLTRTTQATPLSAPAPGLSGPALLTRSRWD